MAISNQSALPNGEEEGLPRGSDERESQGAKIIPLRPPGRWHDPLQLIQDDTPSELGRVVLWSVCLLVLILIVWAALGKLDIIASAEGRLVPKTLVKIVQPAEAGVIKQLLVTEGQSVKAGQVLVKLDTTIASADKAGITADLALQKLQRRRIEAELAERVMTIERGDDPLQFEQITNQYLAHRRAFQDSLEQERSMLLKAQHEKRSGQEILSKLQDTLPTYNRAADAYAQLEKQGFIAGIAAGERQREAIEKARDLEAQRANVAAMDALISASERKISQLKSAYRSELERELSEIRGRIQQLQATWEKSAYKEGLMELTAPQDGTVKDLATTTVGAVVQPGTVVLTLVPQDEEFFADVTLKNEDMGFTQLEQPVQLKLSAYPFQKYGMLTGKIIHISADADEQNNAMATNAKEANLDFPNQGNSMYKVRVQLSTQELPNPYGPGLKLSSGMRIVAEINQGNRSVLEYLTSPVKKAIQESARER